MSKWIDISQPLDDKTAGWPGDTPFSYEVNWSKEETGSVNVGKITMSIHTGTHIDAPFHFDSDGKKVIDLDLDLYIGRTKVVHIPANKSIGINELSDVNLKGGKPGCADIITMQEVFSRKPFLTLNQA